MTADEDERRTNSNVKILIMEGFYGGSHRQLIDLFCSDLFPSAAVAYHLVTLPARKWHWRLMSSSLYFARKIPPSLPHLSVIFCSSMFNLAELLGFRPDLAQPGIRKILYFHENQLAYPTRVDAHQKVAALDFQIAWTQIVSCVVADVLVFNSDFNRRSFLSRVGTFLNHIPDPLLKHEYSDVPHELERKSQVLYFPIQRLCSEKPKTSRRYPLRILWNHRWEVDKNPADFFNVLHELHLQHCAFEVVVCGEMYHKVPQVFTEARQWLEETSHVVHWGYARTKESYVALLESSDVVVSTSLHEFYGVSVLEATLCGCFPLCPNRLVYPELYPPNHLYNTPNQLRKQLADFCADPAQVRQWHPRPDVFDVCTWSRLQPAYQTLFRLPLEE